VEAKADTASRLETAIEIIDTLRTSQAHALLVGVDVPPVATGSRADIDEMRGVLLEAGLAEANVQILTGEDASASAIRSSFKTLAARAKDAPALFYYAGPGTLMDMRTPGITDFARTAIPLEWFRSTVGDDITNLITIFDAGWKSADLPWGPSPGSRFSVVWTTPRDLVWPQAGIGRPGTTRPGGTGLPDRQRDSILSGLEEMRIGRATIFHVSIRHTVRMAHNDLTGETVLESDYETSDGISRRGILTSALITELRKSQGIRLVRLREVADGLRSSMAWLEPFVLCDNPEQPVLANTVKEDRIAGILHEIADLSPVVDAIAALEALRRESRSADPSVHVDTAAAFAALHDYTASLDALDAARRAAVGEDPEIEFERGRVLFESGRDFDAAVSSLHKAVRATPDRPEAHYYLGAAIRSRVEREAEELDRAVEAFNRYLTLGAPLGHTEEIEAFLSHRRNAP
jgi:hypothetical protein